MLILYFLPFLTRWKMYSSPSQLPVPSLCCGVRSIYSVYNSSATTQQSGPHLFEEKKILRQGKNSDLKLRIRSRAKITAHNFESATPPFFLLDFYTHSLHATRTQSIAKKKKTTKLPGSHRLHLTRWRRMTAIVALFKC